jgi:rubrerythrin
MDIFEFALKMELDGKAYYEKLAAETSDTGLKAIFTTLAADEQKHHETIQAIKSGSSWVMKESVVLESAKNLFEILKSDQTIADGMKKSLDGYQFARKIEAASVKFYENAAKKESNATIRQLLLRIAEEEKGHYNILDNLYDFTLAPRYFLAWREFSNIKEL